ncbi:DEAD/DEAH box helicase [uncultured Parabacteroides sp.]|uniref:DEAD/DEAH box helicase n=1 Tax=uncultured Parabacteroides sp. TaxID=512312 RepID=UPI002803F12F|nr:DEAD/DEAH box helicase [uncultured Parabacteroides sp.]
MEENSGRSFARSTKALYLCKIEGKDMSEGHQLIVTINNHPVFGPLLIPYLAREVSPGVLEAEEKATFIQESRLSTAEKKIITLSQCYSEKNLMKVYSKERTVNAFLTKLSDPARREPVRNYIDRKQREIVELLQASAIPLYIRETATKLLYEHHRIFIPVTLAEASFRFELTEQVFRYAVECESEGRLIPLQRKKPVLVLCARPAILVLGRDLLVFKRIEMPRLNPFLEKTFVEVPASETRRYLEKIVLPMMVRYPVSASGFDMIVEYRPCVAELSVSPSVLDRPLLQLRFYYGDACFSPRQAMQRCYPRLEEEAGKPVVRYFKRNQGKEQECLDLLGGFGFTQVGDTQFSRAGCVSEYALVEWLHDHKDELEAYFTLNVGGGSGMTYFVGDILLEQDITDTPDWFEIRITVRIGEHVFPFILFRKHILEGDRLFKLPDGKVALLPEEWFEKYGDLFSFSSEQEGKLRVRKMHLGLVDGLRDNTVPATSKEYVEKEDIPVPPRIRATLRPYQREGFTWMAHLAANGFGGCLADDMGLGKTLQTITLLQYLYDPSEPRTIETEQMPLPSAYAADKFGQLSLFADEGCGLQSDFRSLSPDSVPVCTAVPEKVQASLIVVPASLLPNWKREIQRFSSLRVYEYAGDQRSREPWKKFDRYPVVLTTYGLLRRDIELLENYAFKYVILDESQNIKNPDSVSYHAVMRLKSDNRLVLTGTPIENSLKDLWAQFNFINPGLLGSLADFRNRFINPVVKEGNERARQRLQQLIRPFFLRRTKEQVAPELPPLMEEVVYCGMSEEQQEVYTKEKNTLRNSLLEEWHKNKIIALNGITRLRQLANHPGMIFPEYTGNSGKMDQVLEAYETLLSEGHKVLIFSSFVTHLKLLAAEFEARGWDYALLTGSTTDREGEIARFSRNKEVSAFFISLKAGGVGLNLTDADYVFILDPWWNPAAEMQAESRAHRIGQQKQVFVFRFITSGTIEEKIRRLQERKSDLSDRFITENDPLQQLTDEEWRELV